MKYVIDTDYNDGYTAPEVIKEAVALMSKLNPIPYEEYAEQNPSGFTRTLAHMTKCFYCPLGEMTDDKITNGEFIYPSFKCSKHEDGDYRECYWLLLDWYNNAKRDWSINKFMCNENKSPWEIM